MVKEKNSSSLLITGGAGFIGSNLIQLLLKKNLHDKLIILDKLTYAGNLANLSFLKNHPEHRFIKGDIGDSSGIQNILETYQPRAIFNFAAETHVDRSIQSIGPFVQTNVTSTCSLLETTKNYWKSLDPTQKQDFRFIHISTDEVYGSLKAGDPPVVENSTYSPNSPYAASKASADHFARAIHQTYSFPIITTHTTNNFGPRQYPEKLIPLVIYQALQNKPLPIYGKGKQKRSWIYVEDHCNALLALLELGTPGEVYHISSQQEMTNLELVHLICEKLNTLITKEIDYKSLITFISDRPAHDERYALDSRKIMTQTGWRPLHPFDEALQNTIVWYLENREWLKEVNSSFYREWLQQHYSGKI